MAHTSQATDRLLEGVNPTFLPTQTPSLRLLLIRFSNFARNLEHRPTGSLGIF